MSDSAHIAAIRRVDESIWDITPRFPGAGIHQGFDSVVRHAHSLVVDHAFNG